ncbi:hypothetical protein ZWY2020_028640 [Hordeum vulgare]|nr:hypothetical protein ZWY2020_028640 [Hordeum vulgare]
MTTSPSSRFCLLDYRAFIFSTNLAAASWGDKILGPPVSDPVKSLFKASPTGFPVALLILLSLISLLPQLSAHLKPPPSPPPPRIRRLRNDEGADQQARVAEEEEEGGGPYSVTENDVLELVEHGMIVNKSWRLPEGKTEPAPKEGERVLLLSHVFRGFSLPPHPFFRGIMTYFGA